MIILPEIKRTEKVMQGIQAESYDHGHSEPLPVTNRATK